VATVTFEETDNKISARLNAMIGKAKNPTAFLRKTIYPMYQEAQMQRWQSENSSETGRWDGYKDPKYAAYKKIKYAGFPGGGGAIGIATGQLSEVAMGRRGMGSGLNRIIETTGMTISIDDGVIPYAKYFARTRPIMAFGRPTILKIKSAIGDYLMARG
jgi:hypothetical protein